MTFPEKLDLLMESKGLNKHSLSDVTGVGYTTIDAFYKKGYKNMKLSNFRAICDYFGVTMDCMARDDVDEIEYYNPDKKDLHITRDEEYFLKCYRAADDMHKGLAQCAVDADKNVESERKNQNAG